MPAAARGRFASCVRVSVPPRSQLRARSLHPSFEGSLAAGEHGSSVFRRGPVRRRWRRAGSLSLAVVGVGKAGAGPCREQPGRDNSCEGRRLALRTKQASAACVLAKLFWPAGLATFCDGAGVKSELKPSFQGTWKEKLKVEFVLYVAVTSSTGPKQESWVRGAGALLGTL